MTVDISEQNYELELHNKGNIQNAVYFKHIRWISIPPACKATRIIKTTTAAPLLFYEPTFKKFLSLNAHFQKDALETRR